MNSDELRDLLQTLPPPMAGPAERFANVQRRARRRARTINVSVGGVVVAAVLAGTAGLLPATSTWMQPDSHDVAVDPTSTSENDSAPVAMQVLSDVIEATFSVPGTGQRRSIRVNTFISSWMAKQCGGRGAPIDSTAERFSQDTTPDLELIRERGFVEKYVDMNAGSERGCDAGSPGNLVDRAPTFQEWFNLKQPWAGVEQAVLGDGRVTALKEPLARCLQERSGLRVSAANPASSYLGAVDGAEDVDMQRFATIYADCGKEYFAMIETLMLEERPALVEKHRAVLEQFASEMIALGYAP